MIDIDYKKSTLNRLGIIVLDGNSNNIFIKYKDKTVPYDTQSFLMYNANYLITDVCKLFEIDNNKDMFLINLEKKKEYLKKLRINKLWYNEDFYLQKDKTTIKYDFDDFVDMDPDLFIADVKNKFNKLETLKTFNDECDVVIKELPHRKNNDIFDVAKMKSNIKTILKERGLIAND